MEKEREGERKTSHRQVASALLEPALYVLKIFPRYEPNEVARINWISSVRTRPRSRGPLNHLRICLKKTLMDFHFYQ